jgi:hypothetical protein
MMGRAVSIRACSLWFLGGCCGSSSGPDAGGVVVVHTRGVNTASEARRAGRGEREKAAASARAAGGGGASMGSRGSFRSSTPPLCEQKESPGTRTALTIRPITITITIKARARARSNLPPFQKQRHGTRDQKNKPRFSRAPDFLPRARDSTNIHIVRAAAGSMTPTPAVSEVELHPLVLLSVVDHYYRVVREKFGGGRGGGAERGRGERGGRPPRAAAPPLTPHPPPSPPPKKTKQTNPNRPRTPTSALSACSSASTARAATST